MAAQVLGLALVIAVSTGFGVVVDGQTQAASWDKYSVLLTTSNDNNETQPWPLITLVDYFGGRGGQLLGLSPSQFVTTDNTGTEVSGAITNSNGAALSVSSTGQVTASMSQDLSTGGNPWFAHISVGSGSSIGKFGPTDDQYFTALEFASGASRIGGGSGISFQPNSTSGPATVFAANDGEANVYSTTPSTSCTNGALVVNGGVGIAKDVYVGGNLQSRILVGYGSSLSTYNMSVGASSMNAGNVYTPSITIGGNLTISGSVSFPSLTAESLSISSTSSLTGVMNATSGINFGQSDASTLSAYSGLKSWTPALSFGGSSSGITYSYRSGTCVRIGNMITCSFAISLSSKGSATGTAKIEGLPWTLSSATQLTTVVAFGLMNVGSFYQVIASPNSGTTNANINLSGGTNGYYNAGDTTFNSNSAIWGVIRGFV